MEPELSIKNFLIKIIFIKKNNDQLDSTFLFKIFFYKMQILPMKKIDFKLNTI